MGLQDTFHSGGANRSAELRWGFNCDLNLALYRQEENQFLACAPQPTPRALPATNRSKHSR